MSPRTHLPLLSLAVVAGLLAGWSLARLGASSLRARPGNEMPGASPAVPALEARAADLRLQGEALRELLSRLEACERRLDELTRSVAPPRREALLPDEAADAPREPSETAPADPLEGRGSATVGELQDIALDAARSTRDRILAVEALWRIELQSRVKGARTNEVVGTLLDLLELEQDAELRRQICFNVLGALEPWHKRPLLDALALDLDASVRSQAADSLQDLQGEPDVRAALEEASRSDPDGGVRSTALEMLRRWDERR